MDLVRNLCGYQVEDELELGLWEPVVAGTRMGDMETGGKGWSRERVMK